MEIPAGNFTPSDSMTLTKLPAFCRVEAVVSSGKDSEINFAARLPAINWNGKLVATGNGGYGNVPS